MDTPNLIQVTLPAQVVRETLSPDRTAGLITDALGGPVDGDTRLLLVTAGRGDPALTIARWSPPAGCSATSHPRRTGPGPGATPPA